MEYVARELTRLRTDPESEAEDAPCEEARGWLEACREKPVLEEKFWNQHYPTMIQPKKEAEEDKGRLAGKKYVEKTKEELEEWLKKKRRKS